MSTRREREDVTFSPLDNRTLANLCGPLDANLRQIEAALDVTIGRRGGTRSPERRRERRARHSVKALLRRCREAAVDRRHSAGLIELSAQQGATTSVAADDEEPMLRTRRADLHGRTPNQTVYLKDIQERHHLRHRTGGHRQSLSCCRLRRRRTRAR
jgi:phosphate starvation-inducible PhoH-like protein